MQSTLRQWELIDISSISHDEIKGGVFSSLNWVQTRFKALNSFLQSPTINKSIIMQANIMNRNYLLWGWTSRTRSKTLPSNHHRPRHCMDPFQTSAPSAPVPHPAILLAIFPASKLSLSAQTVSRRWFAQEVLNVHASTKRGKTKELWTSDGGGFISWMNTRNWRSVTARWRGLTQSSFCDTNSAYTIKSLISSRSSAF